MSRATRDRDEQSGAVAVIAMGVYPKPFTDVMHTSVVELLRHSSVSKIAP